MSATPDVLSPSDPSNPWTTLATRLVYENPWIRVREDRVTRPDGKPGIYGVVEFKNNAVGVLPVDEKGDVWLVGQYRYPLRTYSWEIPEGGGPAGEPPVTTAERELREETGLRSQARAGRDRAPFEFGERRAGLHFPGDGAGRGATRARGNRKDRGTQVRVARSVFDGETG